MKFATRQRVGLALLVCDLFTVALFGMDTAVVDISAAAVAAQTDQWYFDATPFSEQIDMVSPAEAGI